MARTSRQQRRQRRGIAAGVPPLRPPTRPVAAGDDEPPRSVEPSVERSSEGSRGVPGLRFIQESIAELKKVEWPGQQAVVSGTAVVIVACFIVGVYLYANDRVWTYFVEHVLLR
jgi:preprotein translocase SecE subunit